jgi:spermidine/putrescine transport system substrate-binding protein
MASTPEPISMLAPVGFHEKLSRRALLKVGTASAGLAVVATACGSSSSGGANATTTSGPGSTSAPGNTTAGGDTTAAPAGGLTGSTLPNASGDWSRVINKASGTLSMYTWGDYNDPDIVGKLAESDLGVTMKVDYYTSNEDLITKLSTSNGASGFDIVVPTGPYIPQMIQKGLLEKFDKTKLPNMVNVDGQYLGKDWDKTNDYSVCKDWGTTGYMWDSTVISKPITSWQEFMDACIGEGSGNCSWLDTAPNVCGPYFWANGINWNTDKKEDLDAAEAYLVDKVAKHIKAFDSYPSTNMAQGAYALSMFWNGDARQAYVRIKDAGGKPENFKWAIGSPATEIWMDNYAIAKGAPNMDAAHAWINWLLVPEISIKDLVYHGYNSGMKNIDALIKELVPTLANPEMVFFSADQVKSMQTQTIGASQDRLVDIYNKVKAKAAG